MGFPVTARPRTLGDVHSQIRDLRRQVNFLRSARAVTLRSLLAELAEGADSLAGVALAAAVLAQSTADAAARVKSGTATGTTTGAGEFTINHGFGAVPALAVAQVPGAPDLTTGFVSATSTTATFVLVDRATGAVPTTAYTVHWSAIV